ncbi:MAG: hypothetical protein J5992_04640 [Oscillospiraceae bacterium]|nr:hypothetical protein [Oscillospiraceae bacterium]
MPQINILQTEERFLQPFLVNKRRILNNIEKDFVVTGESSACINEIVAKAKEKYENIKDQSNALVEMFDSVMGLSDAELGKAYWF